MKIVMNTGAGQKGELGEESSMLKQQNEQETIYDRVKVFSRKNKMTFYVDISKKWWENMVVSVATKGKSTFRRLMII